MEICCQDLQQDCSIKITNRTCTLVYKTKGTCGCDFIKPVYGFECCICKVFLPNEDNIEEHVSSFQHLTIYEIHLRNHAEHHINVNQNENNINGQTAGGDIIADENHGMSACDAARKNVMLLKECDAARNGLEIDLVRGGMSPENNDTEFINAEKQVTRTISNGVDRALTTNIVDALKTNDRVQSNENLCEIQTLLHEVYAEESLENITEDHIGESDSGKGMSDSSERFSNLIDEEREAIFEGILMKLEAEDEDNTEDDVNKKVCATKEHATENGQCYHLKTALEVEQRDGAYKDSEIKQEANTGYDYDEGIIAGFLEDHEDMHNHSEPYNGKLMPSCEPKNKSSGQEKAPKLTEAACLLSDVEEMCMPTPTTPGNEDRCETTATAAPASQQNQGINETSNESNSGETTTIDVETGHKSDELANLNVDICVETKVLEKEHHQKLRRSLRLRTTVRNVEQENLRNDDDDDDVDDVNNNNNNDGGDDDDYNVHDDDDDDVNDVDDDNEEYKDDNDGTWDMDVNKEYNNGSHGMRATDVNYDVNDGNHGTQGSDVNGSSKNSPFHAACEEDFTTSCKLKKRNSDTSDEEKYPCAVCGKSFLTLKRVELHRKREHTVKKKHSCHFCAKSFYNIGHHKVHELIHTGERPFSCDGCGKTFIQKGHLTIHKRIHTGEKPFSCNICTKAYYDNEHLKRHKRTHHTKEKPYSCDICGKRFPGGFAVKMHMRRHTDKKPYSCDFCGKGFYERSALKVHHRVHTGEKPFSCDICGKAFSRSNRCKLHERTHLGGKHLVCDLCGKKFMKSDDLKTHRQSHSEEKQLSCDICGKKFMESDDMKTHRQSHAGEKQLSCDFCGKKFMKSDDLKKHRRLHAEEEELLCGVCGKAFRGRRRLTRHKKLHLVEKRFACDVCEREFVESEDFNLTTHMRIHTDEEIPFSCDVCGKVFKDQGTLNRHKFTHTAKKFSCDICGKLFSRHAHIKRHEKVHAGKKPFSCDVCGKRFVESAEVTRHARIHTGEKRYSCEICGKAFLYSGHLRKHKLVHTGDILFSCDICGKAFKLHRNCQQHKKKHGEEIPS